MERTKRHNGLEGWEVRRPPQLKSVPSFTAPNWSLTLCPLQKRNTSHAPTPRADAAPAIFGVPRQLLVHGSLRAVSGRKRDEMCVQWEALSASHPTASVSLSPLRRAELHAWRQRVSALTYPRAPSSRRLVLLWEGGSRLVRGLSASAAFTTPHSCPVHCGRSTWTLTCHLDLAAPAPQLQGCAWGVLQ